LATKYYVVWEGRETGIFTSWPQCQAQVIKYPNAKYKSFSTLTEAEAAFGKKATLGASNSTASSAKGAKKKASPLTQAQVSEMPYTIKIFTDGACEPNPGEAGTGLAVYENNDLTELWYGIYQAVGTNNTAELNGLYQAQILAKQKIDQGLTVAIYCDSTYAIQSVTTWAKGWKAKGWKKSSGEIKNLDLIKEMYALQQEIEDKVAIYHVNGHVGIEGNELADRMSIIAIETKEQGLSLYRESSDIDEILASRRG
jgi:ribonuclease HI